jgi:hypothetical protein
MASAYLEPARLGVGICPQAAKPPLQSFGPDSCGTAAYTPAMMNGGGAGTLARPALPYMYGDHYIIMADRLAVDGSRD